MTDSNPYDELKADLEYWCNLSENSFSNYLANEHDTLLAEESTGSASFDQFRNEFEIVQNTCKKFLEVYDYATLIPDIQKLLKLVDWFTAAVRKYLNTSESIAPDTLSIYMIGFENMLNDSLKYILSIISKLNTFRRILI